jgi:predicted nucleic acid-binding protein
MTEMSVKVVDASALGAIIFAEPEAEGVVRVNHVEVIELAKHTRLTTYDSSYLWLAQKTGAKLVTLDKRLKKAIAKGSMAKG